LCDYLQADELMHVKTGTKWVRRLTDSEPERREDLAGWGRTAVARIERFYAEGAETEREAGSAGPEEQHDVRFTFRGGGGGDLAASPSNVIGE
jgi:hypothetical protein